VEKRVSRTGLALFDCITCATKNANWRRELRGPGKCSTSVRTGRGGAYLGVRQVRGAILEERQNLLGERLRVHALQQKL
jgi:hypothetical protein